jgi:hypothetical protein
MSFTNYSPDKIKMAFAGIPVLGYAKGSFVKVGRNEDAFSAAVGSNGDVVRVQNLNHTGLVVLTLMQSSPTNALFAQLAKDDERLGTKFGDFLLKDLLGTTLAHGAESWIVKQADIERSDEHSNVEWHIYVADLEIAAGSALT